MLLLGGRQDSGVSNVCRLFDIDDEQWTEEETLSPREEANDGAKGAEEGSGAGGRGGGGGGLYAHKAIQIPKGANGVCVYCIGGFIDTDIHPSYMTIVDIGK